LGDKIRPDSNCNGLEGSTDGIEEEDNGDRDPVVKTVEGDPDTGHRRVTTFGISLKGKQQEKRDDTMVKRQDVNQPIRLWCKAKHPTSRQR
jgi:hypothetical protein